MTFFLLIVRSYNGSNETNVTSWFHKNKIDERQKNPTNKMHNRSII